MQLARYMLDVGDKEMQTTRDDIRGGFKFGGKRLTKRSFKARCNGYCGAG